MSKKNTFGKNKRHLSKKVVICAITIILVAGAFVPIASACHTPGIKIAKTGPIFGYVEDEITYNYNISNIGDVPLSNVNVGDDQCGPIIYVSGDKNENGKLDTDEIWTFNCTCILSYTSPNPLVNIANVSGVWNDKTVYDEDSWSVEVMYPDQEDEYTLTINVIGNGSVAKDPDQQTYTYGTIVELNATADPGWIFDHWEGDLSSSENPEAITMDSNKTVIANFTEIEEEDEEDKDEYTLTINVIGNGSVSKDPDQITYLDETLVNLTANADCGWMFNHWEGDLSGYANPEAITMDGDKTVIANFTEIEDECEDDEDDEEEHDDNPIVVTSKSSGRSYTRNHPPVANATGPYYGITEEEIEFDGSNSYDKDGEIIEYLWNFGDGTTGSGKIVTHSYAKTGRYTVTLTVIDNFHLKSPPNITSLVVIQPNRPPSIPEISGPSPGNKDITYSYAATSSDLDNDDLKYIFDWGDENKDESEFITLPKGTAFSMKHSWDKAGEYTITVTVSDNQSTSSSEMTVLIEENISTGNIAIVGLVILVIIALILMIDLMYNKKRKKA